MSHFRNSFALVLSSLLLMTIGLAAQALDTEEVQVPDSVSVQAVAADRNIAERLQGILDASEWFSRLRVRVDSGVVFLDGVADTQGHKEWAVALANRTEDVIAVVDRLQTAKLSIWDFTLIQRELSKIGEQILRSIPFVIIGLISLGLTLLAVRVTHLLANSQLTRQIKSSMLRNVVARSLSLIVFLIGLSLVLRLSGLSQLALTLLGGTGLIGLVIGFAFRDIAENFLASILLSIQRPFRRNDLIEVAGVEGYVTSVNTRCTLLMTREGNHVQIPNATIYKQVITNFTANSSMRLDFTIGIGYDDHIDIAQATALNVLEHHPSVLQDPPPSVLVEELGAATVNLRITFWINVLEFDSLKVRSAVIEQVKLAFQKAHISMPDAARERIFPQNVPVQMLQDTRGTESSKPPTAQRTARPPGAEDLSSEAADILEQARQAPAPEQGTDILD